MKRAISLMLALSAATTFTAHAQDFPRKTITMIVPFAAGGPTDRTARDLAEALRGPLGATVVVENSSGAGSSVGSAKVARAAPDGYTLLLNHISMSTMPALLRNLPFSVTDDFEYLGLVNDIPMTLISRPTLEANDYAQLSEWIGKAQGKVNIGNAGVGSASHLCGLLYQSATKTEMVSVPYKGTAPAISDLIGGQIDLLCDQSINTLPQIQGKKVKGFAVTTAKRLDAPALKDLPTLQELGLKDFEITIWHGLYAPKGTPPAVTQKLNEALKTALKDPAFIKKTEDLGARLISDARVEPAEHKKFVQSEIAKWTPVIKAAGVYAD